jgi:hypothetical protein
MAALTLHNTLSNRGRDLIGALRLAITLGLTDTVIGTITNSGTIAKLRTVLVTLKSAAHEADKFHFDHILGLLDAATDDGIILDADVDAARDASSNARIAALLDPIAARLDGVTTARPSDFQIL